MHVLTRKRRGFIKRFVYQHRMFAGNIYEEVAAVAAVVGDWLAGWEDVDVDVAVGKLFYCCRKLGKS